MISDETAESGVYLKKANLGETTQRQRPRLERERGLDSALAWLISVVLGRRGNRFTLTLLHWTLTSFILCWRSFKHPVQVMWLRRVENVCWIVSTDTSRKKSKGKNEERRLIHTRLWIPSQIRRSQRPCSTQILLIRNSTFQRRRMGFRWTQYCPLELLQHGKM